MIILMSIFWRALVQGIFCQSARVPIKTYISAIYARTTYQNDNKQTMSHCAFTGSAILRVASLRVASLRVASLRVASLRVASLRVASLRVASLDLN